MKKWIFAGITFVLVIPLLLFIFRKNNLLTREQAIALCEEPNSKYLDWNGMQMHYTEWGSADTTILMVHGFGGSHKNFDSISKLLKDEYHVICVDIPAFGLSQVPEGDYADEELFGLYQSHIRYAAEKLCKNYYHLIGNSMGGWISWDMAAGNDSALLSLTLLNSAGFEMGKAKESATGWMTGPLGDFIFKKGVPFSMALSNAKRCFSQEELVNEERVRYNYYMLNKEGTFPWMLRMAKAEVLPDTARLSNIQCPSLVVWGSEDEIIPVRHADKFVERIPNSHKLIYDKCGHTPQMEYPDQFVQDWRNFVANSQL
jgi:pimeloyl-ACP methyl ester carboxylesterase